MVLRGTAHEVLEVLLEPRGGKAAQRGVGVDPGGLPQQQVQPLPERRPAPSEAADALRSRHLLGGREAQRGRPEGQVVGLAQGRARRNPLASMSVVAARRHRHERDLRSASQGPIVQGPAGVERHEARVGWEGRPVHHHVARHGAVVGPHGVREPVGGPAERWIELQPETRSPGGPHERAPEVPLARAPVHPVGDRRVGHRAHEGLDLRPLPPRNRPLEPGWKRRDPALRIGSPQQDVQPLGLLEAQPTERA